MKYTDKELTKLVNSSIDTFIDAFCNDSNIISIFAIGSMASETYTPKKYNDFDLRLLVLKPTHSLFQKIEEICNNFVLQHKETTKYELSWNSDIGPVRQIDTIRPTFLLHIIVLTESNLANLPAMHRLSYAKSFAIFLGRNPIEDYKNIQLDAADVLSDIEGVRYCKECLSQKVSRFQKWNIIESKCELISCERPFTTEDAYEFFKYSIIKNLDNCLTFFIQTQNINAFNTIQDISTDIKPFISITYEEFCRKSNYYLSIALDLLNELEIIVLTHNKERK